MIKSPVRRLANFRGFTLIEILVVIAIISLLAAILFPVFARARDNARRASCSSNIRQILLGMMQYTQDYDERFPLPCDPNNHDSTIPHTKQDKAQFPGYYYLTTVANFNTNYHASLGGTPDHYVTWMDFLFPYLKSTQIFTCPSSTLSNEPSYQYSQCISRWNVGGFVCGGENSGTLNTYPISQAALNNPSQTVLIAEANTADLIIGSPYFYGLIATPNSSLKDDYPFVFQHFSGSNIGYADGHVKWISSSKWIYLNDPAIGGGPNWDPFAS